MKDDFSTLYGQHRPDEHGPTWHCGWTISRNGGVDENGEWRASPSWRCSKIIRPSYNQHTALRLVVHVYGKPTYRPRPRSWSAELRFGWERRFLFDIQRGKSCRSIPDALRKAESLKGLDVVAKNLLQSAYAPHSAEAVYREMSGTYTPWMTRLVDGEGDYGMPHGRYFSMRWRLPLGATQHRLHGTEYDRSSFGYVAIVKEHELLTKLDCWLPSPPTENP